MTPTPHRAPPVFSRLPKVSRLAGLWTRNAAASHAHRHLLATLARRLGRLLEAEARLEPLGVLPLPPGPVRLAPYACYAALELGDRPEGAVLEVDLATTSLVLQRLSGGADEPRAPGPLSRIEEAALAWALLEALHEARLHAPLERALAPRLVTLTADPREALAAARLGGAHRELCAVEACVTVDGRAGHVRLVASSGALEALVEALPQRHGSGHAERTAPAAWRALELEARCLLSAGLLAPSELLTLCAGDVVLLPRVAPAADGLAAAARLVAPHFTLSGRLDGRHFTLERADARAAHPEPTMIDAPRPLAVELEVELARVRLPLAELYALSEGAVLPLHIGTAPCVRLWLGDRMIARAELVEVDGQLGARLLSLCEVGP